METERKKNQREVHETQVALQIARLAEKKRIAKEKYWQNFGQKKEANNG